MTTTSSPIACVRLPELPIVAHHTGAVRTDTTPRSVHRGRGTHARVLYCDALAWRAGVRPGQSLAAARGRTAALDSRDFDPHQLTAEHHRVVERLLQVTPRIRSAGADRFWVEPTVVGHPRTTWDPRLFEAFTRDVLRLTGDRGPVAVGIGPSATVAWAAAFSLGTERTGHRFVSEAEARAFLDEAPLEAIEIDPEARDILASLGIRRVRELRAQDPVSLGMRFGPAVAAARRRIDGLDARAPLTVRPVDRDEVLVELDDEVAGVEPLSFLLGPATERLATMLRRRDRGAVHVRLTLDGGAVDVRTGAPLVQGRAMLELLRTRLERARLSAPVTRLHLEAVATVPLGERTEPLFRTAPRRDPGAREVALDRLRGRLGETAVRRAERVETGAVLERARWMFAREIGDDARGDAMPWRRLEPPAPVVNGGARVAGRWRRVLKVGRVERTAAPWWQDGAERIELVAWAELEGPLLTLLHARCSTACDDEWEVIAWVD